MQTIRGRRICVRGSKLALPRNVRDFWGAPDFALLMLSIILLRKEYTTMMLYPPVAELVDKVGSRYQLVNLVARRARVLAAEAEDHTVTLDKKPVSAAIDEVYTGKLTIR